jgi:hypothetical protein
MVVGVGASVVMMAVEAEAVVEAEEIVVLVVIGEETAHLQVHSQVVVEAAVGIVVHHVEMTLEVHPQAKAAAVVVEIAGETVASSAIKVAHATVVVPSKADMVVEAVDRLEGTPNRLVQLVHPGHLNQPSHSLKKKSLGQFHFAHLVSSSNSLQRVTQPQKANKADRLKLLLHLSESESESCVVMRMTQIFWTQTINVQDHRVIASGLCA